MSTTNELITRILDQNNLILKQNEVIMNQNNVLLDELRQKSPFEIEKLEKNLNELETNITNEQNFVSRKLLIKTLGGLLKKKIKKIAETLHDDYEKNSSRETKNLYNKAKDLYEKHRNFYNDELNKLKEQHSMEQEEQQTKQFLQIEQQVQKTKPKKNKRSPVELVVVVEEKDNYSPSEIKEMDNYELCSEFIRITGCYELSCNHCKKPTSLDNWINSIRKRCEKKGLSKDIKVPKTCDKQQAVNSICNPINNKVYPVLRSNKTSETKKQKYLEAKQICFAKIGKDTQPHKY